MTKILTIIASLFLSVAAFAAPTVTWDDPNPQGTIAHYLVYEKVVTGGTTTWKPIWKVVASKEFNLPTKNVSTTYTVTAVNTSGIEGPRSNELTIHPPQALQNLRIKE